jgi:hypothetical protein
MSEENYLYLLKTVLRDKMINVIFLNKHKEYKKKDEENIEYYQKRIKQEKLNIIDSNLRIKNITKNINKADKRIIELLFLSKKSSIDLDSLEKEAEHLAEEYWNKSKETENPETENPETE